MSVGSQDCGIGMGIRLGGIGNMGSAHERSRHGSNDGGIDLGGSGGGGIGDNGGDSGGRRAPGPLGGAPRMALDVGPHLVLALGGAAEPACLVGAGPPDALATLGDAGHATAMRLVDGFCLLLLVLLYVRCVNERLGLLPLDFPKNRQLHQTSGYGSDPLKDVTGPVII